MSIGSVTAAANSAILTSERTQAAIVSSASRLASGKQIQTAADNPSGLAIYETLTAQAAGLEQATNNVGNAQNAAGVAEGALSQVSAVVSQLNTLSIAASNDFLSPVQRQALQAQANQDAAQINTISQNTNFNGQPLLQNNGQPLNVQATAAEGGTVGVAFGTTNARTLGVSNLDFGTTAAAETAIGTSQTAIDTVATTRAQNGAQTVALGIQAQNDQTAGLNLTSSASNIADLNYAQASTNNSQLQALQAIDTTVLQSANSQYGYLNALINGAA